MTGLPSSFSESEIKVFFQDVYNNSKIIKVSENDNDEIIIEYDCERAAIDAARDLNGEIVRGDDGKGRKINVEHQ